MKQSESLIKLTEALIKVQAKMENAKKDSENPFFSRPQKKATYADLASVLDTVRDLLAANGLAIIQPVEMEGDFYYIETMLMHISGEYVSSRLKITPMKQSKTSEHDKAVWVPSPDPQSIGTAIQYGRRYALQSLLCIAAEDDDGNAASGVGHKQVENKQDTTRNFEFLRVMKVEKERLGQLLYYATLKLCGFEHSNKISKKEDQVKTYKALKAIPTPAAEDIHE